MSNYKTESRGYWKVTKKDLEMAAKDEFNGIDFLISGTGANWKDGAGIVCIPKGSDGWQYLFEHIARLNSFSEKKENSNSKKVPEVFKDYFHREKYV